MTTRYYAAGEVVYRTDEAGDELYQLVSGNIRLYTVDPQGRELLYIIHKAGNCFGEMSLIDNLPRAHIAQAIGETEIRVLRRRQFEQLWMLYPEISRELCRLLCSRERDMFGVFEGRSLLPLSTRIAIRLYQLASTLGTEQCDGIHFDLRITQEDISLMVAASRQAVNKVLKDWQGEGIIVISYGNYIVKDLQALKKLTASSDT
jgi:CRP-like cAMP-binding protein